MARRLYFLEGTMHFLTATCVPVFDVRALFCPLEPLQTHSCDLVASCLVSDVCQDRSATCTVLTPKEKEKECVMEEKSFQRTNTDDRGETKKILKAIKLGGVCYLLVHVIFGKIW